MKNVISSDYAKGAKFAAGALAVIVAYSLAGAAFTSLSAVGSGSGLTSSSWNLMVADLNDLNTRVSAISGVPTGTVIAYNGTSCPSGWTEAAGAGVPAGPGGNASLNLRGQFVRGWNSTAGGLDAGRGFGSAQNGSLVMNDIPQTQRVFSLVGTSLFYDSPQLNPSANYGWTNYSPGTNITGNWGLGTVDANYVGATRPTNIALLYCVKN